MDQAKRLTLNTSPCKNQRYKRICGRGGIGRLGGFRFLCESVQVRVLSSAPYRVFITDLAVVDTRFFLIVPYIFDIMKMKGSDRMRKNLVKSVCVIILTVLILCSGCTAALQELENAEVRQSTEGMLDALIANDFQTAYSLVNKICAEEDFKPAFTQMQELLGNVDTYELKLLSIYTNGTLTNGQKVSSVSSVYEMTTQSGRIIVSIRMDDQVGLNSFYLTPYEKTDYYFTGTLNNLKDATGAQWGFLLLNVIAIGFTVFALVDCSRQKIKKKALWILLLLLGFISLGATISSTSFRLNFNVGWITAYSALIRYGSGTVMLRLMLPVGTIIYFAMRRSLLKESTPAIVTSEKEPETMEEEIPTDQQPNPVLMDDQTEATTDIRQEQG